MPRIYETAKVFSNVLMAKGGIIRLGLVEATIAHAILPGQFVVLEPLSKGSVLPRPFSVYYCGGEVISLAIQVRGKNTECYAALRSGDTVKILGPCGQPAVIDKEAELFLLVGGGCGLASLYWLAANLGERGRRVLAAGGFKSEDFVFGEKMMGDAIDNQLIIATEDGSGGFRQGTAVDLLEDILGGDDKLPEDRGKIRIFTCGPKSMMRQIAQIASGEGIPCLVFMEEIMGCGLGACKGCAIKTVNGIRHICEDGPIFLAKEVIWDEC